MGDGGSATAAADMRRVYDRDVLLEGQADPDPIVQFARWFEEAATGGEVYEPNAVALATADAEGRPSVRMVLLKGFDARGFAFYTNLESRKADEIAENPRAALLFYWDRLHRQVRIEGDVAPVGAEESDAYYASRPYGSRIGAWASPQSRTIGDRAELERAEAEFRGRFPEDAGPVPRPPHWGGLRLAPDTIEFWQGRRSRLHDRLLYTRAAEGDAWRVQRLAP